MAVTCPDCNGDKVRVGYACPGFRRIETPCSRCKAMGLISEVMLTWLARGEAMRANRLERSLSQSEEAKRLGINRVEYSQMEHGMIEPIDYDQLRKDLSAL